MKKTDERRALEFLNKEGAKYDFFPEIKNIENDFAGLKTSDCYIMEKDGEITAFGGLWDQTDYKQYIITKYAGALRGLSKLGRVGEMLGYIPMPKENEVLKFPTLSLFISKDGNKEYYEQFLACVSKEVSKNYKMFVVGVAEKNKMNEIYKKYRCLKFDSLLFLIDFNNKNIALENDIHIECGLL
jgi:hypothetical protein